LTRNSASISGCISTLSRPRFQAEDIQDLAPPSLSGERSELALCDGLAHLVQLLPGCSDLVVILYELQHLASTLNHTKIVDLKDFLLANEYVQYSIIMSKSPSNGGTQDQALLQACCLGALIFLKSTYDDYLCNLNGSPPAQTLTNAAIFRNFASRLDALSTTTAQTKDLFLWLLFLGGIIAPDRAWYVARLAKASLEWNFRNWDAIKTCLMRFLWVEKIHSTRCKELWEEALITRTVLFGESL
jgi:hypothetical protein